MKNGYENNKDKLIKVSKLVHFDYSWKFSNGVETAHYGENFKRILKQMYVDSPSPSLVLKSNGKGF